MGEGGRLRTGVAGSKPCEDRNGTGDTSPGALTLRSEEEFSGSEDVQGEDLWRMAPHGRRPRSAARKKKIGEKRVEQERLRKGARKKSGKESGETSGKNSDRSKGSGVKKDKGMKEGGALNVKTDMELRELKLGDRKPDAVNESDGKDDLKKHYLKEQKKGVHNEVLAKTERKKRGKLKKKKGEHCRKLKIRKRLRKWRDMKRDEKRALVFNMQDNEDNEEKMMDVDYNNLDKELGNVGVRKVLVKSRNVPKPEAVSLYRCMERYEKIIGRMSVENERLEMRLSEQEKTMDRRMKEMEKRMQKVKSGMNDRIKGMFDNIEEKMVNMCGSMMERLCGSMNLNDARERAQPGAGRTAAALENSYALIVKGDKELRSMEKRDEW
ncbi:hypothetical protein TSAR_010041 [Trichomalopsis sarcophagae]|uniref:Uncharacterized protein n=1 Tax=Trichomalopsis sarcophagae TaxID=543379 RepID=A0A232EE43_9HYME|nr:hypothetical protein TSAR_010041 [Trichomalopsis sarcophagae]